jgi:hypothetical protein
MRKEFDMPQRMGSPFQFGQAVLEPIVQPVYDRATYTAATPNGTLRFFVDVAAKTERDIFPGITSGGQLSAPRLAVIYGLRLAYSEDVADATAAVDLKNLLYNSFYRFHVGVKDYAVAPAFWFPAGLGVAGFAATGNAVDHVTATNGVPAFFSRFSIEKRKIAIPPQQAFFGELVTAGAAALAEDRDVWNFLDSEFGFEVQ